MLYVLPVWLFSVLFHIPSFFEVRIGETFSIKENR
jgi:hypothetical protein